MFSWQKEEDLIEASKPYCTRQFPAYYEKRLYPNPPLLLVLDEIDLVRCAEWGITLEDNEI